MIKVFLLSLLADWIALNGKNYKFVRYQRKDWADSDTHCQSMGAHLIRMQTEAEFIMIQNILRQNSG